MRGVLYLHSFEYESAAAAFREAQKLDPGFAMAYWGEALTYTHPVWNEQNVEAARTALRRLAPAPESRRAKAPTARERAYLEAVEVLYGDGAKERRDTLYSRAMERLSHDYPDDHEARTFYALSLLGLSQGTRDVSTYVRAGAIADDVFRTSPNHPGAAHYVIHAFDDPVHAPLGLCAARAYSKIAPDAAHAQHMTTHIFVALGLWDDVVSQNVIASGHDHAAWRPGHYTAWLGYGLLQQGRINDARKHLETVHGNVRSDSRPPVRAYLMSMRAHYLVNSERWDDPARSWTVNPAGVGPGPQVMDAFALGYAALRRGDRAEAGRHLADLIARGNRSKEHDRYGASAKLPSILEKELRAVIRNAEGAPDEAISLLREATAIEDALPVEYGPPDVVKPSHELFGEVLLSLRRPAEAQREFARALELAPRRALSLLGLARAAAAAGDSATAARAYGELRDVWHRADAELPALAEARRVAAAAK
ncbi:MAG: hypothetical protein ACR2G6_02155 [Gemmatimonadaceae bacterium]